MGADTALTAVRRLSAVSPRRDCGSAPPPPGECDGIVSHGGDWPTKRINSVPIGTCLEWRDGVALTMEP
jgi:hypothetical protein